jgi:DNA polymerase-3 subunit alpha
LDDFTERVPISIEQLSILIKINAFRFTGINKRELLWEAHLKAGTADVSNPNLSLFKTPRVNYSTPELPSTAQENAFDQIELLGYPLCNPFKLLAGGLISKLRAKDLESLLEKMVVIDGYLVTAKPTKTSSRKPMFFGTFLDADGYFIDTVHFPPAAAKYPFRGKGVYRITGVVKEEFDCITIEVAKMERLAVMEDPRYANPKPIAV